VHHTDPPAPPPPSTSPGERFGSLCISGTSPRALAPGEARLLANFAELAVRQLERDARDSGGAPGAGAAKGEHAPPLAALPPLLRPPDAASRAAIVLDTGGSGWPVMCANRAWSFLTGVDAHQPPPQPASPAPAPAPATTTVAGHRFFDLYAPVGMTPAAAAAALAAHSASPVSAATDFVLDVVSRAATRGGESGSEGRHTAPAPSAAAAPPPPPPLRVWLRPCFAASYDDDAPAIGMPDGGGGGVAASPPPSTLLPYYFGHLGEQRSGAPGGPPLALGLSLPPSPAPSLPPPPTGLLPPPIPALVPKIGTAEPAAAAAPPRAGLCGLRCVMS
jgi:hypothetical protein